MYRGHTHTTLLVFCVLASACATSRRGDAGSAPGNDAALRPDAAVLDGSASDAARQDAFVVPTTDSGMPTDAFANDAGHDGGTDTGVNRCAGIDCSAITRDCILGVCNPTTGACMAMALAAGSTCDDRNPCTSGDVCSGTTCSGVATDCSALSGPCGTGMCDTTTGSCVSMPMAEGSSCGTATASCSAPVCIGGACVSAPTADCGSCGGGMVCVAGSCGAPPTMLTYDFESGGIPASWTNGAAGTLPWTITTPGHGGARSMRAGMIAPSTDTRVQMRVTLATAASLSFWLRTDTESCCDHLQLYLDGTLYGTQWSGTTAWTQVRIPIASGAHTVEWRYVKDGSVSSGMDTVWIDDVVLTPIGNPNTGFEASATLPAAYTTGGTLPWVIDTSMPHAGTNAAASGMITHSQTSSMLASVALPSASTLSFWLRVQSESCCDHLYVYDNGTQLASYQGDVPWTLATFSLAAGAHTIEWRYSKDGSLSTGLDRAFVDDVDFGFTPSSSALCGP